MLCLALTMTSCFTTTHTVGQGAQGYQITSAKQWYALWGLVPINNLDSKDLARGKENYTVKTQVKFVDYLINAFGSFITINAQTVEVRH